MTKLTVYCAVVSAGLAAWPAQAEACREHCRMRGGVRVAVPPFGIEVSPRARIVIRGPIMGYGVTGFGVTDIGPPPPPPPPEDFEPPPPPPAPPAPAYTSPPGYPDPAPVTVVTGSRPREYNIGVGLRGSALRIGRDGPAATGYGVELRFRARPVELEFDLGIDNYGDDLARSDTRVAANAYVPLVHARFAPYLLAGVGMNFSHFSTTGDELHQGFLAGGGGLGLKLGSRFVISFDGRYMIRRFFDDETKVAMQGVTTTNDEPQGLRDEAVEARLHAMLFF